MAVQEASRLADDSGSHHLTRSEVSCFPLDDPARRSSVRPRSEIEASRSEKKALFMAGRANPNRAELFHGFKAGGATKHRGGKAKKTPSRPAKKQSFPPHRPPAAPPPALPP